MTGAPCSEVRTGRLQEHPQLVPSQPTSDSLQPTSDGLQLQPTSDGLQLPPARDGLHPTSDRLQLTSDSLQPSSDPFSYLLIHRSCQIRLWTPGREGPRIALLPRMARDVEVFSAALGLADVSKLSQPDALFTARPVSKPRDW